jgi:hypothetical protein
VIKVVLLGSISVVCIGRADTVHVLNSEGKAGCEPNAESVRALEARGVTVERMTVAEALARGKSLCTSFACSRIYTFAPSSGDTELVCRHCLQAVGAEDETCSTSGCRQAP